MDYFLGIVTLSALYAILAIGYNFQLGQAGIFSIAHGVFYGVGAYTAAILVSRYELNFWVVLLASLAVTGAVSSLLALLSLRVSGDYLVVSSFAFQLIILAVIVNWSSLTNGSIGILDITRPSYLDGAVAFMIFCLVTAAVVTVAAISISTAPFGNALRASRDDRLAASSLGKRVAVLRFTIFVFTSALAGLAGALYAYYQGFVSPNSFQVSVSIVVLSMVVLGGLGKISGALLGAVVLVALPQVIALIPMPATVLGPIEQMIYGAALVAVMLLRPEGVLGSRRRFGRMASTRDPTEVRDEVGELLEVQA